MSEKIVYVVMGPTGSGKTSLVSSLNPERFEIVSCDSRQVYRELEIGTAAPDAAECKRLAHHMIGIINPAEKINAAKFSELALSAIRDIQSRNKIAVVVGGSGFYYRAMCGGLFEAPTFPKIREELSRLTPAERLAELRHADPAALVSGEKDASGQIHPNDDYRITRALEVTLGSQIPWSLHWRQAKNRESHSGEFKFQGWVVDLPRSEYLEKLQIRIDKMINKGLLEETERVINKYGKECHGLRSLGYPSCIAVLEGSLPSSALAEELFISHRQYGKKQRTWFRKEGGLKALPPERISQELSQIT